ncbi:hypothetical protein VNI00_018236 [Paramarasmius palmivorus]|uniref:Uncharacterized protein n=1 Tax=Paramarasmius palmivorus TaxID=297713 RepID=A0AAW0AYX4_9AGAR
MEWAKRLGTQAPQTFISNMELFLRGFCIASPPDMAPGKLARAVIHLEQCLYGLSSWYRLWFNAIPSNQDGIFILPPDRQLPLSWSCYTVTSEKADTIRSLLNSLSDCDDSKLKMDIYRGTYCSVCHLDSEKKNGLYTLKKLVAQHRQELGLDLWPCTPPPVTEDDLLDGVISSFRLADGISGDEGSNTVHEVRSGAKEVNTVTESDKNLATANKRTSTAGTNSNSNSAQQSDAGVWPSTENHGQANSPFELLGSYGKDTSVVDKGVDVTDRAAADNLPSHNELDMDRVTTHIGEEAHPLDSAAHSGLLCSHLPDESTTRVGEGTSATGIDSDTLEPVDMYKATAYQSNEVGEEGDISHLLFCVVIPVLLVLYYTIFNIYA